MCYKCYVEYGSPIKMHPETERFVYLADKVYDAHPAGGAGHVFLDDMNVGDNHIKACAKLNEANRDDVVYAEMKELLDIAMTMDEDQRLTALAIHEGFIQLDNNGGTNDGSE